MEFSIVCVDDEDNILSALKRLFRRLNVSVFTFNNPEDALKNLALVNASVIISDMRMPNMSGDLFLEKSLEFNPDAIRILLTGYADISSTVDAVNKGNIWKYIQKPWDDDVLIALVRDALNLKKLEYENKELQILTIRQNEELKDLNSNLELKVEERTAQLKDANLKLKQNFMNVVKVFSSMIETKNKSHAGHCSRAGDLSRKAAVQLNLDSEQVNDIFIAGLLHDIGSQGIPDNILDKNEEAMTSTEYSLWIQHPVRGEQILMSVPELNNVSRIIRHHHERWDGKGFPDKLKGESIPQGSRILSAAIQYDLFVTGRTTGRKENPETAARLLLGMANSQLCALSVDAIIAAIGTKVGDVVEKLVDVINLKPGMLLSRDLKTPEGILLLSTGHKLDESLINKLIDAQRGGKKLQLWIKTGT